MSRVFIYKRFERLWHWGQALLVILLALTGFDLHFHWGLFGFEQAVEWHRALAWVFVVLIAFAAFWHATTGEWRQYLPMPSKTAAMVHYYLVGIFKNEPHPTKKTEISKLNPLQRITYAGLKIVLIPLLVVSGFFYYYFNDLPGVGLPVVALHTIAYVHTVAAYLMIAFMVAHVYLTTTGHTVFSNIKAMITGWEEVEEEQRTEQGTVLP